MKILCLIFVLTISNFVRADIVERTRLIEDRLKLQEELRPLGHDFLIDLNAYFSADTMDLVDDVTAVADNASPATAASALLDTWNGQELSFRGVLNFGIPLFTMKWGNLKVVPELMRVQASATVNANIASEVLDLADLATLLPDSVPEELRVAVANSDISDFAGTNVDIVTVLIANNPELAAIPGVNEQIGKYTVPDGFTEAQSVPNVNFYAKAEVKAGPKLAFYGDRFFGAVSLYGLGRADIETRLTSDTLTNSDTEISYPTDIETWDLASDFSLGYKEENLSIVASASEFRLFNMSESENADLSYGTSAMFKVHGSAEFRPFGFLKASPFIGFHMRSGYSVGDAYYLGSDFGAYVWGDRLGINVRAQIDAEHITLAPQLKFWLMQIDGMIKTPITDDVDGYKPGSIIGLNVRLFI